MLGSDNKKVRQYLLYSFFSRPDKMIKYAVYKSWLHLFVYNASVF